MKMSFDEFLKSFPPRKARPIVTVVQPPPAVVLSHEQAEALERKRVNEDNAEVAVILSQLNPEGFINQFYKESVRRMFRNQPVIMLASAIATLAALIVRKVRTPDGQMSTLLAVISAGTGMGKENTRSLACSLIPSFPDGGYMIPREKPPLMAQKLQDDPEAEDDEKPRGGKDMPPPDRIVQRGELPHSGAGLFTHLSMSPAYFLCVDEIGGTLKAGEKDMNGNQQSLFNSIIRVATTGTGDYPDRPKAESLKFRRSVKAPGLVMLSFTQPEKMKHVVQEELVQQGFPGRLLILEGDHNAELIIRPTVETSTVPEGLSVIATGWQNFLRDDIKDFYQTPEMAVWAPDAEAEKVIISCMIHYEGLRKLKAQFPISNVLPRVTQLIKWVALVFAADRLGQNPSSGERTYNTITGNDVRLARRLVEMSLRNIERHLETQHGKGECEQFCEKIAVIVKKMKEEKPNEFVYATALGQAARKAGISSRWFDVPANRTAVMERLVDMRLLDVSPCPNQRRGTRYVHVK